MTYTPRGKKPAVLSASPVEELEIKPIQGVLYAKDGVVIKSNFDELVSHVKKLNERLEDLIQKQQETGLLVNEK